MLPFPPDAHVPPRPGEIAYTDWGHHERRYWVNENTKLVHFSMATEMEDPPTRYYCHGKIQDCGRLARPVLGLRSTLFSSC